MNIESQVRSYLTRVAEERGRSPSLITPDASFMDSGILDSLSLLDFVTHLERQFSLEIPGSDIVPENFGSLTRVCEYLQKRVAP